MLIKDKRCTDDKRHILNDGITTLAYFDKDLKD